MSDAAALARYENWAGRNPEAIRRAVIAVGGWSNVFPMQRVRAAGVDLRVKGDRKFPQWANRVRNYFNETPTKLKMLKKLSREWFIAGAKIKGGPEVWEDVKAAALCGDVYVDENDRNWYQVRPVGTIYHYKGKVDWKKKADRLAGSQITTPVFKLVSPDGTGGSCEIVIWNNFHGSVIGKPGDWTPIHDRHVKETQYQGSYNYTETVLKGFKAHEFRDVDPHEEMTLPYVDPPKGQALNLRVFPEVDKQGRAL